MTVDLTNVVREYRTGGHVVRALDRVTLRINGGEFTSIVGPSGAGKSTLLQLLGALDSPDSGSIQFNGTEIATMTDEQQSTFRRHQVGFVFQFFNLLPTLTAWENVALPMLLDGKRLRRVRADAVALLDRVGLGDRIDHRPAELSGGQMQRVAVARALMMDPPLILADEPTGNLDSSTGAAIMELLRDVSRTDGAGRAVIMVTHDLAAAAQTDRVITVQDGVVRFDTAGGAGRDVNSPRRAPDGGRHAVGVREQPTEVIPTVRNGEFTSHVLLTDPPRRRGKHSAHRR
ncbi:ABC transporter ATP-binding protein [Mycobacterium sp. NPDC006124]|uniref:ABC transporter ATP-binding protein n=1 Tax=Mycobacterium sp. NPDC006124 TaxID=3156729 RepID=UPI0033BBF340